MRQSDIMLLLYAFPISMNILIELHYLPCVQFISKFYRFENIVIDDIESFEKQSYRSRCTIAGANGPIDLIIPVHGSRHRLPVKDVEIDNHTHWQHQHWQSIRSAYGKTAFYEHYAYRFEQAYTKQYDRLFDFDIDLIMIILKILKIDSNQLKLLSENAGSEYLDFKNKIHPKAKFKAIDPDFKPVNYHQAFIERYVFLPNLSILDLIFNEGPEAETILRGSVSV